MAKLDFGIIGGLALGVGIFALSRMNKDKETGISQLPPTIVTPLAPTVIIPTDSGQTVTAGYITNSNRVNC